MCAFWFLNINAEDNFIAQGYRFLAYFTENELADSVKNEPEKQQGNLTLGCIAA
jgi:hypothetical protein